MKKLKKKRIKILLVIFIILTASFSMYFYFESTYVSKVGGERILRGEFSFFVKQVRKEMEEQASIADDEKSKSDFWKSKIAGKNALEVADDEALNRLVEYKIELIKAKESGIGINKTEKEELEKALTDKVNEAGGDSIAEADYLKNYGVNLEEYRDIYIEFRIIYNFMKSLQEKILVTDEETKAFYEENKNKIDVVTIRHILFSTKDNYRGTPLPADKQVEAKDKANETLSKIRNGENMEQLADSLSQDPDVKNNHGIYTVEYIGQNSNYQKEFKDWAISHIIGDTGLIMTANGYHVVRVENRTSFEEVKIKAVEAVKAEKLQTMIEEWKKDPQYNLVKNNSILDRFR